MPSEDLKSRRISSRVYLAIRDEDKDQGGLVKVTLGGRYCTIRRTKTFELVFSLVI